MYCFFFFFFFFIMFSVLWNQAVFYRQGYLRSYEIGYSNISPHLPISHNTLKGKGPEFCYIFALWGKKPALSCQLKGGWSWTDVSPSLRMVWKCRVLNPALNCHLPSSERTEICSPWYFTHQRGQYVFWKGNEGTNTTSFKIVFLTHLAGLLGSSQTSSLDGKLTMTVLCLLLYLFFTATALVLQTVPSTS